MRNIQKTERGSIITTTYDGKSVCCFENDGKLDKISQKQEDKLYNETTKNNTAFKNTDSNLPLKKRLKAYQMMSRDEVSETLKPSIENSSITYPGTLMMSIADIEMKNGNVPYELGATVEVTSANTQDCKKRNEEKSSKNKSNDNKCKKVEKKNPGRKKKAKIEVENDEVSAPKKSKVSNTVEAKKKRSSKRIVPTVSYSCNGIDVDSDVPVKRKRKRNTR